ncbi:MAG: hypothetical protein ACOY0T_14055 [Myxococcota bacterium]
MAEKLPGASQAAALARTESASAASSTSAADAESLVQVSAAIQEPERNSQVPTLSAIPLTPNDGAAPSEAAASTSEPEVAPASSDVAEGAFWNAPPRYSLTSAAPPPMPAPRKPRPIAKILFATLLSLVASLLVYELTILVR